MKHQLSKFRGVQLGFLLADDAITVADPVVANVTPIALPPLPPDARPPHVVTGRKRARHRSPGARLRGRVLRGHWWQLHTFRSAL